MKGQGAHAPRGVGRPEPFPRRRRGEARLPLRRVGDRWRGAFGEVSTHDAHALLGGEPAARVEPRLAKRQALVEEVLRALQGTVHALGAGALALTARCAGVRVDACRESIAHRRSADRP